MSVVVLAGIALATVAVVGAVASLDRESGLRPWLELRAQRAEAELRVATLRDEVAVMRREIDGMGQDPLALERAIREELGWARAGEVVVRLESPEQDAPLRSRHSGLRGLR